MPLNEWHGLTVSDSNIIGIDLKRNHLTGQIPNEIGKLSKLIVLNLSDNNISGELPDSMEYLNNLEILDLSHNNIEGIIDNPLNNYNLIILDLSNNNFKGKIPKSIGKLNKLEVIDLSNNHLSNQIPTDIFRIQRLMELNLQNNGLSGSIPRQIGNLMQITSIDLSRNKLSGTLPKEIGKLINLKERLALNHNQFSGMIPKEISALSKLENIWLNNNHFSGILPFELGKMTNLKSLFIYQNNNVGPLPNSLGNLRELEILYAQNNSFGGNVPQEIWFLPKLKMLKLENNNFLGEIPGDLRILQSIQSIDLSNNQFSAIADTITLPSSLLSFNIANNQLFCINSAESDEAHAKFFSNSLDKIYGIENQDCSKNGWSSFNIEKHEIDFNLVQTDSIAMQKFWITSNVDRKNILQITQFNSQNFILSNSLLKIEQDDTVFVSLSYSPIDQDTHNDVLLIEDIFNNQVKFVSVYGESVETSLPKRDTSIPWKFNLHPIPHSNGTEMTIQYDAPKTSKVNLAIYNLGGKPIKSLVNDNVDVGYHSIKWNCHNDEGKKVEPGEYLCVMQSGMFIQIQHLMILY